MTCKNCGNELPENTNICPSCGFNASGLNNQASIEMLTQDGVNNVDDLSNNVDSLSTNEAVVNQENTTLETNSVNQSSASNQSFDSLQSVQPVNSTVDTQFQQQSQVNVNPVQPNLTSNQPLEVPSNDNHNGGLNVDANKNNNKLFFIIAGVLVVVIIGLVLFITLGKGKDKDVEITENNQKVAKKVEVKEEPIEDVKIDRERKKEETTNTKVEEVSNETIKEIENNYENDEVSITKEHEEITPVVDNQDYYDFEELNYGGFDFVVPSYLDFYSQDGQFYVTDSSTYFSTFDVVSEDIFKIADNIDSFIYSYYTSYGISLNEVEAVLLEETVPALIFSYTYDGGSFYDIISYLSDSSVLFNTVVEYKPSTGISNAIIDLGFITLFAEPSNSFAGKHNSVSQYRNNTKDVKFPSKTN